MLVIIEHYEREHTIVLFDLEGSFNSARDSSVDNELRKDEVMIQNGGHRTLGKHCES